MQFIVVSAFAILMAAGVSGTAVDVHQRTGSTTDYFACGTRFRSTARARQLDDDTSGLFRQGRIVKGSEANTTDLAFMAAIMKGGTFACTAFIIHPRFVLTYSSCYPFLAGTSYVATTLDQGPWTVRTGSPYVNSASPTDLDAFLGFPSTAIPLATTLARVGDFGLFHTAATLAGYGTTAFPICLGQGVTTDNTAAEFAGWGTTTKSGSRTSENNLRRLDMKILKNSVCNTKYYFSKLITFYTLYKRKVLTGLQYCARTNNYLGLPMEGPCDFDQGGPLFLLESNKWTAVGIFSDIGRSDAKCAQYLSPPIFTNVNLLVDTIVAVVTAGDTVANFASAGQSAVSSLVTTIANSVAAIVSG